MSDGGVTLGQLLLVEYEYVKKELDSRIRFRDNLLYVALVAAAAVVGAVLNSRGGVSLLLLLPPVLVVLGWVYVCNDEKVSAAGAYIRVELAPRLSAMVPGDGVVFGWECAHRGDARRRTRKALQLVVDLITFGVVPLAGLTVFWFGGPWAVLLMAVSVVEALVVAVLAAQIVLYADLGSAG